MTFNTMGLGTSQKRVEKKLPKEFDQKRAGGGRKMAKKTDSEKTGRENFGRRTLRGCEWSAV